MSSAATADRRDLGRSSVYAVEDVITRAVERGGAVEFYGSILNLSPDVRFGQVADMQRYTDTVWPLIGTGTAPRIVRSKGHKRAYYAYGAHEIYVPDERWARTRMVLLHELAHAVVALSEHRHAPGHGEQWRKTYCWVLGVCGMPEVALLMYDGFSGI
jgi:putative metallohydrolase (TIGR04338 family)